MVWDEIVKIAATIVGALGGVAIISGLVASYVGKLVSTRITQSHQAEFDRQLETHKNLLLRDADRYRLLLKRQELMFEKEYSAAADFYRLFESIVPEQSFPDLDWLESQTQIAENFDKHSQILKKFLQRHAASLSEDALKLIEKAQKIAIEGSFEISYETTGGEYERGDTASPNVRAIVDRFFGLLEEADKRLRLDLQQGSFSTMTNEK